MNYVTNVTSLQVFLDGHLKTIKEPKRKDSADKTFSLKHLNFNSGESSTL